MPQSLDDTLAAIRAKRAALRGPVTPAVPVSTGGISAERRRQLLAESETPETPEAAPETVSPWRHWAAAGTRIGGSWLGRILGGVVGGVGGAVAGAPTGPGELVTIPGGAVLGATAGGALGGGLGETAAEWIEGRPHLNPTQIAVQTGIGALPIPGGASALGRVLRGGVQQAASAGLTESAETGQLPSAKTLEGGFLLGGGVGYGTHLLDKFLPILRRLRGEPEPSGPGPGMPPRNVPQRPERLPAAPEDTGAPLLGSVGGVVPRRPVPGRLPSDRLRGLPEGPEDTGLPPTGSVGGTPTVAPRPARQPALEILDPHQTSLNASGESAASAEALSRQRSMQAKGQQFVVYDRAGQRRPLLGPDAVDYHVQQGETYGIEGPGGFKLLDDAGGRVPATARVPGVRPEPFPSPSDVETLGPDVFDIGPAASPKPRIPTKITALWQDLKPQWAKSVEVQAGDQIPFTVDPTEDLIPFAKRVLSEDPRTLMGAERKVRAALDAGEEGGVSPELLTRLGLAAGGAAGGSLLDREHPGRGALAGLAVGAGVPALLRNPEMLEKLRYFSMLSGPATQAKNVLGNIGAVMAKAGETALGGDTGKAGLLLRQLFSPKTVEAGRRSFTSLEHAAVPGRWGSTTGITGIPGRTMGAVDEATKDALKRAGVGAQEAAVTTFTNDPLSKFGQGVNAFHRQGGVYGRLALPFARTATNILERGVERLPGIGALPAVRQMTGASAKEAAIRQALGALAGVAGYETGTDNPYLGAAAGPYALPYSLGAIVGKLSQKGHKTPLQKAQAAAKTFGQAIPLPSDTMVTSPGDIPAQFVPNALPLLGTPPPSGFEYDTSAKTVPEWLMNKTLAKIPGLNAAYLRRKRIPKSRR